MQYVVLNVNNLRVEFETDERIVTAVDQISFQVGRGQTLGIVGESGSGKSVTALAIMGLLPTATAKVEGEVWFQIPESEDYSPYSQPVNLLQLSLTQKQTYRGGQISMIFQEPMTSLNPVFTIGFQLTEAIMQHEQLSPKQAMWKAASLLQEVKLLPSDDELMQQALEEQNHQSISRSPQELQDKRTRKREVIQQVNAQKRAILDRYPHELSGGQLQRVMIAMAISCNPILLIADEPTTALDVTVQATILDLLQELQERRGMAMIFITHDLGIVAQIADQVAVMFQGKIVESGTLEQIFMAPKNPYTKGLLACRPTLDSPADRLPTVADFMDIITLETGEVEIREKTSTDRNKIYNNISLTSQAFLSSLPSDNPILAVKNLRVAFKIPGILGQTKRLLMAVNDVSFEVYPGETLGLVGESGCGKSTLSRGILQLIKPLSGQVLFEGQDITAPPLETSIWSGIKNYHNQQRFNQKMRWVRRNMQIIFQDPFSSLDPRISIGEAVMEPLIIHQVGQNVKEKRDRVAYLLERVGLNPDLMRRYPHEFSGGQRQRICIARALALNPKFIICDESVSALDVSVQAQVLNLLKELQSEFNLTYIFISHDLSVVKFMSDRLIVMNQGKIEEMGTAEEIYRHPKQAYTRQLIASIPSGIVKSHPFN
ncbi:putative peptide transport fused subunits of ABC superfamily: ATP-binding components [Planktothrix serta PCC 8927]|uniref:Peptide transport fused subunits of ABC superfamily: ATP-binding components n=1 Tax=Planktothrix serta PCC 8927 TaxID=671068 RepID=A0A7Z9BRC0_9CYAN|nr:ABC transporter ATP-binding protein [Planktothrix serta]VXD19199.1 putative peptide transport fused subunits of ABC superfamily: ATP-binding components [Planktothrix serta PCC 8927]